MSVFDELGDGIFRRRYESLDLNIGVVIGEDAVLLVDSRASHRQADELRNELTQLTDKPVGWVVNTHYHWDHTWGNARFPEAELWGHKMCREEMVYNGELARMHVLEWMPEEHHAEVKEIEITPPTKTFADKASIDIGRQIDLIYYGRGHTNSDIAVVADNVLFAGDLLEEGAPPSFGDAYPLDWPRALGIMGFDDVIVPGHGDVVDHEFLRDQRDELYAVADLAQYGHREGAVIDKIIDRGPYPPETMRVALTRGYAQLNGEI